ncbi:hypothetical protein [Hymenobacter tenuis]
MDTTQYPQNEHPKQPEMKLEQEDHTLEDLAALTGLFNPDVIVNEIIALDKEDEQEETKPE